MRSYWIQSNEMLNMPFRKDGSVVFFPYGTATLLTMVRSLFGQDNHVALGIVYALLGTLLVPLVFYLSERLTKARQLPRIAATITCFYYPLISYGGYYLSELPFALCVTAVVFYSLRLADLGRTRDAFLLGSAMAVGATFRPQLLAAIPLLFLLWMVRRKSWPKWRVKHWFRVAIPILFISVISVARFHYHTGRFGFISGNSSINYAFGRCHALVIEAKATNYWASFSPPPMGYLDWREKYRPNSLIRLDPAVEKKVSLRGAMWTPETFTDLTHRCVKATGYARQARYMAMHILMLWGLNNAWPDSSLELYRFVMLGALAIHNVVFLMPMVLMVIAAFRRNFSRYALFGVHLVALVGISMLYFGDVRYRVPYDALIIVLGLDGWRRIHGWLLSGRWHRWV
jgi:hypothetical protein